MKKDRLVCLGRLEPCGTYHLDARVSQSFCVIFDLKFITHVKNSVHTSSVEKFDG